MHVVMQFEQTQPIYSNSGKQLGVGDKSVQDKEKSLT